MLNQYHKEIQTYKEHKIKAHVELECVFYGLESIADTDRDKVHDRHLKKVDDVKSGVSRQTFLFLAFRSENHRFVVIVVAIQFRSFAQTSNNIFRENTFIASPFHFNNVKALLYGIQ